MPHQHNHGRTSADDLFPYGRHESGHSLHAHLVGFEIESVHVSHKGAHTVILYPMSPETITARFQRQPAVCTVVLQQILGTIRAGALFEGCAIYGEDLKSVEAWHQAFVRHCGDEADWQQLHAASVVGLRRWYRHESVVRAVNGLASMLIQQGETSMYALQSMFGVVGVAHIPDPLYQEVMPSTQRWPHGTRTTAHSTAVDLRLVPQTAGARYSPEDAGWVWSDAAQHGHGGWIK